MRYRAEIDGLRALAVALVILFHAGFKIFAGGFIGVDIFFVISGFLITNILLLDIRTGNFSFLNFYEKRARRILPALLWVTTFCLPFAFLLLLPHELKEFSKSLLSIVAISSNFFFWKQAGYFDTAAELKPLLHTWSLSVEEQYYIIFPALSLILWRFRKKSFGIFLLVIGFTSLFLAEYFSRIDPSFNFYSPLTRAWELMIGALIAYYSNNQCFKDPKKIYCEILSMIGLFLILISVCLFDEKTPFPSFYSLIPTIGTGLILIFAKNKTLVSNILSARVFVGLGLMSYSAYLWHQPLLAFARHLTTSELRAPVLIAIILISLALAYPTWRYIEKPYRSSNLISKSLFVFSCGILVTVFLIFGFIFSRNPYLGLNDKEYQKILSLENYSDNLWNTEKKKFDASHNKPRLLIIGDSYAQDFHRGLYLYLGEKYQNLDVINIGISRRCRNVLEGTPNLDSHILKSDAWCLSDKKIGSPEYDSIIKEADLVIVRSYWDELPTLEMPKLYNHINNLNQDRTLFLGATTFGKFYKGSKFTFLNEHSRILNPSGEMPYSIDPKYTSVELINLAQQLMQGFNYIDVQGIFCTSQNVCNAYDDNGNLISPDGHHLTDNGKKMMLNSLFKNNIFLSLWDKLYLKNLHRDSLEH